MQNDGTREFYIAASMKWKTEAQVVERYLEEANPDWTSRTGWLQWKEDPPKALAAQLDLEDCTHADAVVWLGGYPPSEGKHVEMGMALSAGTPVLPVRGDWRLSPMLRASQEGAEHEPHRERSIFLNLCEPQVTLEALLDYGLTEILKRGGDKAPGAPEGAQGGGEEPAVAQKEPTEGEGGEGAAWQALEEIRALAEHILGETLEKAAKIGLGYLVDNLDRQLTRKELQVAERREGIAELEIRKGAKSREIETLERMLGRRIQQERWTHREGEEELNAWKDRDKNMHMTQLERARAEHAEIEQDIQDKERSLEEFSRITKRCRDQLTKVKGNLRNGEA